MNTKEKLLNAFEQFRPHINGHKTAMNLFFEAIEEVEKLQEQVKNCSIPDVVGQSEQLLAFGWYMMEHSNVNDGKTAKDYLQAFLNQ